MLQVYIDDSGKGDQSTVMVLAGYLSTAEKWTAFSNEWRDILNEHDLDAFRMAQAWRLHRKYHKAGPLQRDWIIVKLLNCIKKYTERAFVVSIDIPTHTEIYEGWRDLGDNFKNMDRYYFSAFCAAMTSIYDYIYKQRYNEKVQIIFDEQGGESAAFLLNSVEEFKKIAKEKFPGVQVDTPSFKTDNEFPPIQAADMLAWLVRREKYNIDRDAYSELESLLLGEALSMGCSKKIMDRNAMADHSEEIPKILAKNLGLNLADIV